MVSNASNIDVVVLGAGVIGLTVALELQRRGHRVAVVAKDLPGDSESTGWASPWAGCNWYPFDADGSSDNSARERHTFKFLGELARTRPDLVAQIPFAAVWDTKPETPWFAEQVELRPLTRDIPGNKPHAQQWHSFITHAPNYMLYLAGRAREAGILLVRRRVSALDQAYDLPELGRVGLVVNASGLGARSLIGVEDAQVYPGRGQTVLVTTTMEPRCIMSTENFYAAQDDPTAGPTYIIPRPGTLDPSTGKSHMILGGTYIVDNYSTLPDIPTAERILRDAFTLAPALAGPGGTSWRDIEVVSHNVGLRPARHGGARVELEERSIGARPGGGQSHVGLGGEGEDGRKVFVVHAYGFGSAGYQQSIGAGIQVADLVDSIPRGAKL